MRGDFLGVKTVTVLLTFLQNLSVKGVPPTPVLGIFFSPEKFADFFGPFFNGFWVYGLLTDSVKRFSESSLTLLAEGSGQAG